jgi:hypothetical protein
MRVVQVDGWTSPYRLQELLLACMVLSDLCVVWGTQWLATGAPTESSVHSTPVFFLKVMLGAMLLPCPAENLAGTFR